MDMFPVNSETIGAVGYDKETKTLRVRFRNGETFDYAGVQNAMFESLRDSPFIDLFFINMIKGRYDSRKIGL